MGQGASSLKISEPGAIVNGRLVRLQGEVDKERHAARCQTLIPARPE
jgi:hypothetical protein